MLPCSESVSATTYECISQLSRLLLQKLSAMFWSNFQNTKNIFVCLIFVKYAFGIGHKLPEEVVKITTLSDFAFPLQLGLFVLGGVLGFFCFNSPRGYNKCFAFVRGVFLGSYSELLNFWTKSPLCLCRCLSWSIRCFSMFLYLQGHMPGFWSFCNMQLLIATCQLKHFKMLAYEI